MIDAKEIRLGIWVDIYGPTQLDEDSLEVLFSTRDYESLNPIPLTPEILIACGFYAGDYHKNYFYYNGLSNHIVQYGDEFSMETADGNDISAAFKHLHQLQNLYFALVNEELIYTRLTQTIPSGSNKKD